MADRVRKPEWLKINIGANERYNQTDCRLPLPAYDMQQWALPQYGGMLGKGNCHIYDWRRYLYP